MALVAGTRLGPYEIVSAVGAGGMGEVYRARDTRLDRIVAVKVLNSALVAGPDLKSRFEREARAISQLNHPNICTLHDVGHDGGTDYLVMEFIDGEPLVSRLRRGPLPLAELVQVGSDIADALDRAHRAGIVHRDLKPGNVMLTKSGAKLLDFGLAKPAAVGAAAGSGSASLLSAAATLSSPSPHESPLTQEGALVGTVQYMSPEQIKGLEADARSDIFAFGAVLYEMATGKCAFQGKSQIRVASAILEDEPASVNSLTQSSPPALNRLVQTCLAKDPDERFQSALDVKLELKWIADMARQPQPAASMALGLKRALLFGGILAALAIAIALALWFELRPRPAVREITRFNLDLGKLQFANGSGSRIAISPDGRTVVVLVTNDAGNRQLYARNLDSQALTAVAGTEGASRPFFSPDSRWVGFSASGKLMKVPTAGGVPVAICQLPDPDASATWGDNGTIVFSTSARTLQLVSADGGTPIEIGWAPKRGYGWVQFLPGSRGLLAAARRNGTFSIELLRMDTHTIDTVVQDGSWPRYSNGFLVYAQFAPSDSARGFTGGLLAVPFDLGRLKRTGAPVPVLQDVIIGYGGAGYYDIAQNGTIVYAPSSGHSDFPVSELVWTNQSGKVTPTGAPPKSYSSLRLAPDASRAAFEIVEGDPQIYTFDFKRKTMQRLTFDELSVGPVFTGDAKRIIYSSSYPTRVSKLWSVPADGGGQRSLLLESDAHPVPSSVSADGATLAYTEYHSATHQDIYLMSLQGDPAPHPLANSKFVERDAEISPDGKFFAYVSDESGLEQIFVQSLSGSGGKWPISNGQGVAPRWSRDGKQLFYIAPGSKLMVVNVNTKNGFAAETPKLLFEGYRLNRGGYDVAPDGRILWARPLDSERPQNVVDVIENFDSLVRQRKDTSSER